MKDDRCLIRRIVEDWFEEIVITMCVIGLYLIVTAGLSRPHHESTWSAITERLHIEQTTIAQTVTPVPVNSDPPDDVLPIETN